MLPFTPEERPTPLFDEFLAETFHSSQPGEAEQQICLVQEIAGGIMVGVMARYQKAVLLYDVYGRAGKGTMERIIRSLVPPELVTAISPFKWGQDYHVAMIAGKLLNTVGEMPEETPIPAAEFKTVLGGDQLTGRHPNYRPFTFMNEAAHLFMSNHLIATRDHSDAFYSRWLLVEFPNSLLRSGRPIDPSLPERIIAQELSGIAYWAMEGAARLLRQGRFSDSIVNDRLMAQWRSSSNSADEFVHEACEVANRDFTARRSDLYKGYCSWCVESRRKPFSKARFKDLILYNSAYGITLAEVNGYETFRGIRIKEGDDIDLTLP
jgi:putative DNA primase/helicase